MSSGNGQWIETKCFNFGSLKEVKVLSYFSEKTYEKLISASRWPEPSIVVCVASLFRTKQALSSCASPPGLECRHHLENCTTTTDTWCHPHTRTPSRQCTSPHKSDTTTNAYKPNVPPRMWYPRHQRIMFSFPLVDSTLLHLDPWPKSGTIARQQNDYLSNFSLLWRYCAHGNCFVKICHMYIFFSPWSCNELAKLTTGTVKTWRPMHQQKSCRFQSLWCCFL